MSAIRIRPYRPEDLERLEVMGLQRHDLAAVRHDPVVLLEMGEAWTLLDGDRVSAIGGLAYLTQHRARAWTLIGRDMTRRAWGAASRRMGARLAILEERFRRVEAETPLKFAAGHRLLVHLGFRFEACLALAGPYGETNCQYVRLAERADLPVRYDQMRALAYRCLVEDEIAPASRETRRAA